MNFSEGVNALRLKLFEVQPGDIGITFVDGILLFTEVPGLEEFLKENGIELMNKEMSFCG